MKTIAAITACILCLSFSPLRASDHLDTAAVIADPAADIADLYAWTSADGKRLNLAMTIVGKQFSDHVRYVFHIDSGRELGKTSVSVTLNCEFNALTAPTCQLGEADRARGEAGAESGLRSERGLFRVFAGLRDDPFFNNVRGTRAALNVAGEAMKNGLPRDGGCPRFDAANSAHILHEWQRTDGQPARNFLEGWKISALVIEVDLKAVNSGGTLLGVWASTEVRGITPGHARQLEDGVRIDRMGRALTGNMLLATFDPAASDALKTRYNQAPEASWPEFAAPLAVNLANYDGFDGHCGDQWLSVQNASPATRYDALAELLADDRLWVNSASSQCTQYLAVEFGHVGAINRDCGGRTPNYDVDVFRSLLMRGEIAGLSDGVDRDDRTHSSRDFPFLAAP